MVAKKIKSWRESTLPCDCHVIENAVKFKMSDSEDNVLNVCTKKARMSLTVNADGSGDDQVKKSSWNNKTIYFPTKMYFFDLWPPNHRGLLPRKKNMILHFHLVPITKQGKTQWWTLPRLETHFLFYFH